MKKASILIAFACRTLLTSAWTTEESPSFGDDFDINSSFQNVTFSHGIPLRRAHRRHLHSRSLHHELFEPRSEIELDYLHNGNQIQTLTFTHDDASYVNIEPLGTHNLLATTNTHPICTGPDSQNISTLYLEFKDHDAFRLAKQYWQDPTDLLFVTEDESCFADEGERSVYMADEISFHEGAGEPLAVRITANHREFGPFNADTASTLSITGSSIRHFKQRHSDSIILSPPHERRWHVTDIPDLPDPGKISSSATSNIGSTGKGKSKYIHKELAERGSIEGKGPLSINIQKNVPRKPRLQPLEDLQKLGILPTVTFIDSYARLHLEVFFSINITIKPFIKLHGDSLSEMFANLLGANILGSDISMGVEAVEDVEVGLQMEVFVPAGYEYGCSLMLWPAVAPLSCQHIVHAGMVNKIVYPGLAGQKFSGGKWKNPPPGHRSWGIMNGGVRMLLNTGLGIWTKLGAHGDFNFTTPGVDIRIPAGSVASVGIRNGETYTKEMEASVKWRAPSIHVKNGKVYASVAMGPKMTLALGLPCTNNISFNMQQRLDMPKLEVAAGEAHKVDEHCQKNGPIKNALGWWVQISIGYYANMVLPVVGIVVDTGWIGKALGPDFSGFMWSKKLFGMCFDDKNGYQWLEGKLNEKFKTLTSKMNDKTEGNTIYDLDDGPWETPKAVSTTDHPKPQETGKSTLKCIKWANDRDGKDICTERCVEWGKSADWQTMCKKTCVERAGDKRRRDKDSC